MVGSDCQWRVCSHVGRNAVSIFKANENLPVKPCSPQKYGFLFLFFFFAHKAHSAHKECRKPSANGTFARDIVNDNAGHCLSSVPRLPSQGK